jgi:hypothetical protein
MEGASQIQTLSTHVEDRQSRGGHGGYNVLLIWEGPNIFSRGSTQQVNPSRNNCKLFYLGFHQDYISSNYIYASK